MTPRAIPTPEIHARIGPENDLKVNSDAEGFPITNGRKSTFKIFDQSIDIPCHNDIIPLPAANELNGHRHCGLLFDNLVGWF